MSSNIDDQTNVQDDSYVSRPGQKDGPVPVQSDDAPVEGGDDEVAADSEERLGTFGYTLNFLRTIPSYPSSHILTRSIAADDKDAIDESNILDGGRTRGAKPEGGYREPGDDEGLPGPEDGTSSAN